MDRDELTPYPLPDVATEQRLRRYGANLRGVVFGPPGHGPAYQIAPTPTYHGQPVRYWNGPGGKLRCVHGVILYGTKCVQCERNGTMTDERTYAPGEVMPDGRIMTEGAGGMPGRPVGRGVVWVTLEQADQAEPHGWLRVGNSERDGLVQVSR
jgi:hypothetical protein